jgi:hypothetical protein
VPRPARLEAQIIATMLANGLAPCTRTMGGAGPWTDLRSSPVKHRALRPAVEAQQRHGQDERADTPDEEVPVRQQQPKQSVEEKDGQRKAPRAESCDAVHQ